MSIYDDRVHWVYRCFDGKGRLVYVGSTSNLFGRLTAHRSGSWWAPQVAKVTAKLYPDGPTARDFERDAIASEHPRWNITGRWKSRFYWDEQHWLDYIEAVEHGAMTRASQQHLKRVRSAFAEFAKVAS